MDKAVPPLSANDKPEIILLFVPFYIKENMIRFPEPIF